jgi:uncharacterized protein YecE (DUF72 family)
MIPLVGCCGWAGKQSDYFAQFPVIEIQSTFYHPPAAQVAAKWRSGAPADFQFSMKSWQLITHNPTSPTYRRLRSPVSPGDRDQLGFFRDTEPVWRAWEKTREIAEVLHAAIIVFQCPASFLPTPVNVKNFSKFFEKLGPQPFRLAWEPRGPAWPPELIRHLCAGLGLTHCVDPFVNQMVYGNMVYWRLHGKGGFSYRYTDDDLSQLKAMISTQRERRPAWVMFNNVPMKDDAGRFINCSRSGH